MTHSPLNTPWLAYVQPNPLAKLRLFCFAYAGGSASTFRSWQSKLPSDVEVCPVELPGRGARMVEPTFTHIVPLMKTMVPALLPYLDRPFAFFGHSLGALVSFEFSRLLLQNYKLSPLYLFVSGRQAPDLPAPSPLHVLPQPSLIQKLRRLNGTPQTILESPEMMQLFLPTIRADLAVDETYIHSNKVLLNCPISVFNGLQDTEVSLNGLEAWRKHTSAAFSIHLYPGDHFFIHTAQKLLLETIREKLQEISLLSVVTR
jgi:medium-chain acyl-[acyl-carrier-protein] hydrolase